jgi:hypothetical protein
MALFIIKTLITALVIAAVSELSRRFTTLAALLVSLPLTSILAFIWIYWDSQDNAKIIEMSYSVFWLVLPSLLFFLVLPLLLKHGVGFPVAMLVSIASMAGFYSAAVWAVKRFY